MPNSEFDLPPVNDPITKSSGHLSDIFYLWFSSFFDSLVRVIFSWGGTDANTTQMDNNNGYIISSGVAGVLQFPRNSNVGDILQIACAGTSTFTALLNKGQTLQHLASTGTTSVSSNGTGICVSIICAVDSKDYLVINTEGAITLV